MQAFLVVPASHSAVASLTSSMHRQGLPRLINSDLEATLTAQPAVVGYVGDGGEHGRCTPHSPALRINGRVCSLPRCQPLRFMAWCILLIP